jgi:hypothetical protein
MLAGCFAHCRSALSGVGASYKPGVVHRAAINWLKSKALGKSYIGLLQVLNDDRTPMPIGMWRWCEIFVSLRFQTTALKCGRPILVAPHKTLDPSINCDV